jgi:hypothetical protein
LPARTSSSTHHFNIADDGQNHYKSGTIVAESERQARDLQENMRASTTLGVFLHCRHLLAPPALAAGEECTMSSEKPVLLVVCGRSCGSIDWVLPVLHTVEQSGHAEVKVFFQCETTYQQLQTDFRDLASVLESSAAEVLTKSRLLEDLSTGRKTDILLRNTLRQVHLRRPLKALEKVAQLARQLFLLPFSRSVRRADQLADVLASGLLRDRLSGREVAYIFHDMPADVPIYSPRFPDAKIVYFQHGTLTFESLQDNWRHIKHMIAVEPLEAIPKRTTWLIGSPGEEKYYRRIGVGCRIFSSGHPKFDPRWAALLKNHADTLNSRPAANRGKSSVLLLSMPEWKFSDGSHRRRLLAQLFRVAARHDWDLRVKLHPDERKESFRAIAAAAGFTNFQWCETSVLGGATLVDYVVCFPTSAAMDAVAAGSPVIEFFDFAEQMHTSFVDAHGSKTSIYRTEGLVEPASSEAELDHLARRAAEDDGYLNKIRADQHARLATLFVEHGGGTDRVLKLLENLRGTKRGRIAA